MKLVDLSKRRTPEELRHFMRDLATEIDSGELCAVAVVKLYRDGGASAGWAWDADVDTARLIGGAAVLQHRLIHELDI